jgi:hypothetical protein
VTSLYLCDSSLVDITADKTTRRGADSTCTDQSGKVFVVVGQDVRKCLICEGAFTRRGASEHAKVVCMKVIAMRPVR